MPAAITAQGLINAALKDLGELAPGETPSTDDSSDGLIKLNEIIDLWNSQRLFAYSLIETGVSIAANTQSVQVGPGTANPGVPNPPYITAARILVSAAAGTLYNELEILSEKQWNAIKSYASGAPLKAIHRKPTTLISEFWVWPVPPALTSFTYTSPLILNSGLALGDTVTVPYGYELALRLALAVELAPQYGRPLDGTLAANAIAARNAIRSLNAPPYPGAAPDAQANGSAQPAPPDASDSLSR